MSQAAKEAAAFLIDAQMTFIATVDGNEPRVRAFQFQFEDGGKLWYCTGKSKDVYKQLEKNPAVEICAVKPDMSWVRVTGKVTLDDSRAVKERILSEKPFIKSIYESADNPEFTVFCLEHATCAYADFSGNPPRQTSF